MGGKALAEPGMHLSAMLVIVHAQMLLLAYGRQAAGVWWTSCWRMVDKLLAYGRQTAHHQQAGCAPLK